MAAPIESRPPVVLTATQYAALFRAGQSCPPFRGLFGRFIWGNNPSDFELLAAREKQLAFLMDEELLRWLAGVNGAQVRVQPHLLAGVQSRGHHLFLPFNIANFAGIASGWKELRLASSYVCRGGLPPAGYISAGEL
jgi:hypothetical protein